MESEVYRDVFSCDEEEEGEEEEEEDERKKKKVNAETESKS